MRKNLNNYFIVMGVIQGWHSFLASLEIDLSCQKPGRQLFVVASKATRPIHTVQKIKVIINLISRILFHLI